MGNDVVGLNTGFLGIGIRTNRRYDQIILTPVAVLAYVVGEPKSANSFVGSLSEATEHRK